MELATSMLSWVAFQSIYGIAAVAAVAYFLAFGLKKISPRLPDPFIPAALVFVLALCTLPSIPRYQFEKDTLADMEGKAWVRVISTTNVGDLTEPLTWFHAPIGSFFLVMPNSPIEGGFSELLLQYDEEPQIRMTDPDCMDGSILYSAPDKEGVMRYTSMEPQRMSNQEISIYCDFDWSAEIEALRAEFLKDYEP